MTFPGRRSALVAMLAAIFLGVPTLIHAQNARIMGTVRDAEGAVITTGRVTAVNAATGATRSTTTSVAGTYTISGLTGGNYNVTASAFGYRKSTRQNVAVSTETTVDFTLDRLALQAITVTATLREQELADIPFSIAAPTASVLRERGADNLEAIAANVAGFTVQNLGPGQNQVAMRGASSGQIARDQPGVKEQVGAYLDDSPISLSLFTPDLDLFDLSRVEVLRGPQGTLFGAGSLSGTVRYITNQPELGVNSTFGEVGTNMVRGSIGADVRVGTNVPMGDKAAGRLAVYHNRFAGYMDAVQPSGNAFRTLENDNSGQRTGVRASVLVTPSQRFSVTPRIVFQRMEMKGWNRIDTFNILANPYTTSRPTTSLGERKHFTQIGEPFTDDFVLGDVNLGYNLGRVNLTSISSLTYRNILVVRDAGALTSSITGGSIGLPEDVYTLPAPLDDKTSVHVFTQEVRFAGGGDRTKWLLGAFYTKNKRAYAQSLLVSGFQAATGIPTRGLRAAVDELFFSDLSYDLNQSAVFGEGTLNVAQKLDLTAGLRYYNFNEDRGQVFDGIFGNNDNGNSLVSVPGSTKADGVAPRFIASFKANQNLTLNAQASKGFRLGGINDPLNVPLCSQQDLQTFSGRDSWKDETAWNYEAGAKTNWLNGRAALNLSAFYMDIRDLQLIVTAGSCSSRLVFNVPKSVSKGVEFELSAAPNQFVDFSAATTLNKSELRSTLTSTAGGTTTVVAGIQEGNRLPSVPEVQGSASLTLHRPMAGSSQGFLTTTFNYVGNHFTQIDDHGFGVCLNNVPPNQCPFGTVDMTKFGVAPPNGDGGATIGGPLTQSVFNFNPLLPAYSLLNFRVGMTRGNWESALYLNNVADERALLALDRERGTRARVGYLTNQPRTVGVTMRFSY